MRHADGECDMLVAVEGARHVDDGSEGVENLVSRMLACCWGIPGHGGRECGIFVHTGCGMMSGKDCACRWGVFVSYQWGGFVIC